MSQLLVMTFDGADEAHKVREALRDIEKAGRLSLDDFAIVTKDAEGKVHVKNVADKGMKWGAVGGAVLGPFLMFMFPIAGIALGAAAGAVVGKFFDMGVDKKFVKEVTESLKPNGSALFLLGRGDPTAVVAALRPFQGTLVQTTVPPEIEQELKDALK